MHTVNTKSARYYPPLHVALAYLQDEIAACCLCWETPVAVCTERGQRIGITRLQKFPRDSLMQSEFLNMRWELPWPSLQIEHERRHDMFLGNRKSRGYWNRNSVGCRLPSVRPSVHLGWRHKSWGRGRIFVNPVIPPSDILGFSILIENIWLSAICLILVWT